MQLIAETVRQACHWSSDIEESTDEADDQLHHKQTTWSTPVQPDDACSPFHRDRQPNQQLRAHWNRHVTLTGTVAPSHVLTTLSTAHTHCCDGRRREQEKPIVQIRPRRQEKKETQDGWKTQWWPRIWFDNHAEAEESGFPHKKIASGVDTKETIGRMERKSKGVTETVSAGEWRKERQGGKKIIAESTKQIELVVSNGMWPFVSEVMLSSDGNAVHLMRNEVNHNTISPSL